jgi:hypothetical protein
LQVLGTIAPERTLITIDIFMFIYSLAQPATLAGRPAIHQREAKVLESGCT